MSRSRSIYDNHGKVVEFLDGEIVWAREDFGAQKPESVQVIKDIEPYQSMVTGEMITSRSRHRDHLRQHNCIEVGNEKMVSTPKLVLNNRREFLHRQLGDMSDRQANRILKELRKSVR